MEELQREVLAQADRLAREQEHLDILVDSVAGDTQDADANVGAVALTLAQAKRVRRDSTLLVRALARLREHLQPNGGTR